MSAPAYCTMFDSGYLARGLALIDSMRNCNVDGEIWVLCLDDLTQQYLNRLDLPGVRPFSLHDLEQDTENLASVRNERSRAEYFFTCTPSIVTYVLKRVPGSEWVTYLDADMYFFDSPDRVFSEVESGDIGIVPHRFPNKISSLSRYGTYNVAWVMFRNTPNGRECAEWWRDRCIEWCFDRPEQGKYADQGYLDQFAEKFPTTIAIQNPGVNLAPWNLGRHEITLANDYPIVDGRPLVFFHFHGLRRRGDWIYPSLATYKTRLTPTVRDCVYAPYIAALDAIERGSASINYGHPIPNATTAPAARNQRSVRSAAYRGRRRLVQAGERLTGSAFRIAKHEKGMQSREYS